MKQGQDATRKGDLLLFMRRKDTTSEMMRSYITGGLLHLLESKAFQDITISQIAEKAGVNRSTYYRHFKSKEEIVFCFYDTLMGDLQRQCEKEKPDTYTYLSNMFSFFSDRKRELLLLHRNGLSLVLLEVLNKYFGKEEQPGRNLYEPVYHIGGVFNCLLFWFSRDMEDTPQTMTRATLAIMPKGFTPYLLR